MFELLNILNSYGIGIDKIIASVIICFIVEYLVKNKLKKRDNAIFAAMFVSIFFAVLVTLANVEVVECLRNNINITIKIAKLAGNVIGNSILLWGGSILWFKLGIKKFIKRKFYENNK